MDDTEKEKDEEESIDVSDADLCRGEEQLRPTKNISIVCDVLVLGHTFVSLADSTAYSMVRLFSRWFGFAAFESN